MDYWLMECLLVAAQTPADSPSAPAWTAFLPIAVLLVVFYVLLIRPQSVRNKQHAKLLESLKVGDKVVTSGGIVGVVVGMGDRSISIRSADSKLDILKSSVSDISDKTGKSGEKG